jgi:hypothetical protein
VVRSAWRTVANPNPLGTPGVTPRHGRRTVSRAHERGPEVLRVLPGTAGLDGMQAQLGSPSGDAAPNWALVAATPGPAPTPAAPAANKAT